MDLNSNEFKALKKTLIFFVLGSIGAVVLAFATLFIALDVLIWCFIIGTLSFGFWFMYQVNLEQIKNEERFNDKKS